MKGDIPAPAMRLLNSGKVTTHFKREVQPKEYRKKPTGKPWKTAKRGAGIEIEPKYFEIACARIENEQRQERMFA